MATAPGPAVARSATGQLLAVGPAGPLGPQGVGGPPGAAGPAGPPGSGIQGQLTNTLVNGINSNIPTDALATLRLGGPTAPFSAGGFAWPLGGAVPAGFTLVVVNATPQPMTIVNEDASSTAAYRITVGNGSRYTFLKGYATAVFVYDGTTLRWVLQNDGIRYPTEFDIRDYGAKCDGVTDDGPAINEAIVAAAAVVSAGGCGIVVVPADTGVGTMIQMGSPTTTATGVVLQGLNRPTDQQVNLKWVGAPSASGPMLQIRNSYGWAVNNIGFDAQGDNAGNGAAFCVQLRGVVNVDTYVCEHGSFYECFFTNATQVNLLYGDVPANVNCADDVSVITCTNCNFLGWEHQTPSEPHTSSHFWQNALNGLGNSFPGCQWSGSTSYGVAVTGVTNADPSTITTALAVVAGNSVVFSGTGTALDFSKSNQAGYPVSAIGSGHFQVTAAPGGSSSTGFAYRLGYPLWAMVVESGRAACYNNVDSALGIGFASLRTPGGGTLPGGLSVHEHESQSANWIEVSAGTVDATTLYPIALAGVHHSDIFGYGAYSVHWSRSGTYDTYTTCAVTGGFFGRGWIQENAVRDNVSFLGPSFAASLGGVSGAGSAAIQGWWTTDGTLTVQLPPGSNTWPANTVLTASGGYFGVDSPGLLKLGTGTSTGVSIGISGDTTTVNGLLSAVQGVYGTGVLYLGGIASPVVQVGAAAQLQPVVNAAGSLGQPGAAWGSAAFSSFVFPAPGGAAPSTQVGVEARSVYYGTTSDAIAHSYQGLTLAAHTGVAIRSRLVARVKTAGTVLTTVDQVLVAESIVRCYYTGSGTVVAGPVTTLYYDGASGVNSGAAWWVMTVSLGGSGTGVFNVAWAKTTEVTTQAICDLQVITEFDEI